MEFTKTTIDESEWAKWTNATNEQALTSLEGFAAQFKATSSWSDQVTATPIADIRSLQQLSMNQTGYSDEFSDIERRIEELYVPYFTVYLPRIKHTQRRYRAKLRMLRLGRKHRKGCTP